MPPIKEISRISLAAETVGKQIQRSTEVKAAQKQMFDAFQKAIDALVDFTEVPENMQPLEPGFYEHLLVGNQGMDDLGELTPETLVLTTALGLSAAWDWVVPARPVRLPGRSRPDMLQYFAASSLDLFTLLPVKIEEWCVLFQLIIRAYNHYAR